jgi:hypothetical protein
MLTPTRRGFLLGAVLAIGSTACGRAVAGRPTAPPSLSTPAEILAWNSAAQAMLSDTLKTLRIFEVLVAYRVSSAADSSLRLPSALAWDPPTGAAWDDATHVARGLRDRANQLFVAVTSASIDQSFWREQRRLADSILDLLDLGDALAAVRDRIDQLPTGDGSGTLGLLDQAWAQWDRAALPWGVGRSEPIGCGS